VGFVQTTTVHTLKTGMAAGAASNTTGSGRVSVHPSWVCKGEPMTGGWVGTPIAIMGEAVAVQALGKGVEM